MSVETSKQLCSFAKENDLIGIRNMFAKIVNNFRINSKIIDTKSDSYESDTREVNDETKIQKSPTDNDDTDDNNWTAIHWATYHRNTDMVEFLKSLGADFTLPTKKDMNNIPANSTPLHIAATQCDPKMMLILTQSGMNVNLVDINEHTPLWKLASESSKSISEENVASCTALLLHSKANPNEVSSFTGTNVFIEFIKNNREKAVSTILNEYVATAPELPPRPCNPNSPIAFTCSRGRGPLHYAAEANALQTLYAIISWGAQPNQRDTKMNTPMHFAASVPIVDALIKNGARDDLKNKEGAKAGSHLDSESNHQIFNQSKLAFRCRNPILGVAGQALLSPDTLEWVEDGATDSCMVCKMAFTMLTIRRHHCRCCGLLVCDACSTQRFQPEATMATQNVVRICDGCYNLLANRNGIRRPHRENQGITKEKKKSQKILRRKGSKGKVPQRQQKNSKKKMVRDHHQGLRKDPLEERNKKLYLEWKNKNISNRYGGSRKLNSEMLENRRKMLERGEKLNSLANKSTHLSHKSSSFLSMAKKLNQKQSSGWFS